MKGIRIIMAAALLAAAPYAGAQGVSSPYSPGITQDAVSYWLPRTRMNVTVHARKTAYTPGEFSRYAERYLRMTGISTVSTESWEITGIETSTAGVPDKDRLYTLTFPSRGVRPSIQLTPDGVLWAVNRNPQPESPAPRTESAVQVTKGKDPHEYLTEEILMAGSTSKMAELTAREIYSIRESRNAITRGQADFIPTDGESLKFILEQLDAQESALLTLFTGKTVTEDASYTIAVDPEGPVSRQVLFRFSTVLGVLPVDNLAGAPVWMDITDMTSLPREQSVDTESVQAKKSHDQFLYYRIPGTAGIRIYDNRTSFLEDEIQIAQMGSIEVVSSSIMGRHADAQILFDTRTGNISSINK
ncbi:MAG: DUF4831 family protein [Bacteroidaceae bacterium]|nr:DUF4831 family protein [Bacteroidaceae bacterium]